MAFQFAIAQPPPIGLLTLKDALAYIGLSANQTLVLDARDPQSYTPNSQKWLDRTSGGYDFFLGSTVSVQSTDPQFIGNYGTQSVEYFQFDGTMFFRYDTTNETWMNAIHKDNALFTVVAWAYRNSSGIISLCGTNGDGSGTGFGLDLAAGASAPIEFGVKNGASTVVFDQSTMRTNASGWMFLAYGLNEATGARICQINGTQETTTGITYTLPSALAASQTMEIGALGNAQAPMASNNRLSCIAIFSSLLTAANLTAIFNQTRGIYGV